jgi:hypothetical protein
LLFLDIDGVLLPFPADPNVHIPDGRIFPNETLAALSLILEAFPKRKISRSDSVFDEESINKGPKKNELNDTTETEVDIVLSSTWRVQKYMRNDIIADFRAYGIGPLSTFDEDFYDITDPNLHTERQHEIYEWLQRHSRNIHVTHNKNDVSEMFAWVALDDEELLHGPTNSSLQPIFDGHVIHCDSQRGLTQEQAMEAIQLLRRQLDV